MGHRFRARTARSPGAGVALAVTGPGDPQWTFLHKASFVLWFGAMTIHVLAYAPRLPRLLLGGELHRRGVVQSAGAVLGGRAARWLLLAGSLGCGLMLAAATLHLTARWVG